MLKPFSIDDFVRESNRIEGIVREPTAEEIVATIRFVALKTISIADLVELVAVFAPGKPLREHPGMNVRVGRHLPPPGGVLVVSALDALLHDIAAGAYTPRGAHCRYEDIHPFMDGNGRSGRALWLKMMGGIERAPLGFLHTFYYQTLQEMRTEDRAIPA